MLMEMIVNLNSFLPPGYFKNTVIITEPPSVRV